MKQETLEEAAKNESEYLADWEDKSIYKKGFIDGAKWQQEKMYSEEEVLELIKARLMYFGIPTTKTENINWFEQFKKK